MIVFIPILSVYAGLSAPDLHDKAYQKQHRAISATGDLIEKKKDLRKFKLFWDDVPGADGYETCLDCEIGADGEVSKGTPQDAPDRCGGNACLIVPDIEQGQAVTLHVRAYNGDEKSPWSTLRQFRGSKELGDIFHEEL
jgi:hypothetical protein